MTHTTTITPVRRRPFGPDLRPYVAGRKGLVVLDFEFEEVA